MALQSVGVADGSGKAKAALGFKLSSDLPFRTAGSVFLVVVGMCFLLKGKQEYSLNQILLGCVLVLLGFFLF